MSKITRTLTVLAAAALCGCSADSGSGDTAATLPAPTKPGHVFILVLENENYTTSFPGPSDPPAQSPYLANTLPAMGQLLTNYYGTGHLSNDNYLSMISGQGPNADTQGDCQIFSNFNGDIPPSSSDGQAVGQGCVFPADVPFIGDQLEAAHLTWKAYMEDMGNDLARDSPYRTPITPATPKTCGHPKLDSQDGTQSKQVAGGGKVKDYYAARHNPFVYFHSLIDDTAQARCDAHVVPLDDSTLTADLSSVETTPNYVFITPNLCSDGHDASCDGTTKTGLQQVDAFLSVWVPRIVNSPAFKKDGLLIVTFDEAEFSQSDPVGSDTHDCSTPVAPIAPATTNNCAEATAVNSPSPGILGPGGGRVGAILVSRFITPGSVNGTPYNHYSMLRSVEDIFGLDHLALAGASTTPAFGSDVYNNPTP